MADFVCNWGSGAGQNVASHRRWPEPVKDLGNDSLNYDKGTKAEERPGGAQLARRTDYCQKSAAKYGGG
jgi:hypothetical protein